MSAGPTCSPRVLPADERPARAAAHEARIDRWAVPHRERRRRGQAHPVLDFLSTHYSETPGRLRRWHPGPRVGLAPSPAAPAPHGAWRWYATGADGIGVHAGMDLYIESACI